MSDTQQQLRTIEMSMEDAKAMVKRAEALDRLHANKDFKDVILDEFFVNEASRCVLAKGDPEMQESKHQAGLDVIIQSIGGLKNYFGKLYALANIAENSLAADQETRQELLEEESGDTE